MIRLFVAETRNGSVKVILDPGSALEGPSRADTRNGTVTFKIPEGFGCVIKARTSNGKVKSDFPLEHKSKKSASGTIGRGGPSVTLSTSNGSVSIRQR